jgi:hypothetical protein
MARTSLLVIPAKPESRFLNRSLPTASRLERNPSPYIYLLRVDFSDNICIGHLYIFFIGRHAVKATVLDLRYRMKEVLKALDKREKVAVFYHGKIKGTIIPAGADSAVRVKDHPFFGMAAADAQSVSDRMDELRKPRLDDF